MLALVLMDLLDSGIKGILVDTVLFLALVVPQVHVF